MNAPVETVEREIKDISGLMAGLSDGFFCGPFTGRIAELIALGEIACPGCGLYVHAPQRKAA